MKNAYSNIIKRFIQLFISCILFITSCTNNEQAYTVKNHAFSSSLDSLAPAYQDSLKAKNGGLTSDFLYAWGDRYWQLVKENPGDSLAPEAAQKAFSLYEKLNNENLIEEKLNELSIHDRAMSGVIPYWNYALWRGEDYTPTAHPYPQKLQTIADSSRSEDVQIAARFHLARWLMEFKYSDKAMHQLNLLDFNHQVFDNHPRYGKGIKQMRTAVDDFSAGKTMPSFTTKLLSGKIITKKNLKNKITFFYFYGSGCGSCVKMYPKITRLYHAHKDAGFNVIGFAFDWRVSYGFNSQEEFKTFATKYNIAWPQAIEYNLWDKLQVQALSTGYLIDQDSKIVRISRSETVSNAAEGFENTTLEEAVAKLLENR